jgi:ABC-type amino acid transport substrate-binding protein
MVSTVLVVGFALSAVSACSTTTPTPRPVPLRVGVTTDSPPFAFRQDERIVGLEVDFARELAQALGRPLQLVELEWAGQIPALTDGRIDVIMSGMTITRARQVRIAFSEPYLRSGLLALMRREDAARFPSPASVLPCTTTIAVVNGTTAERFVRERCERVAVYPTARAAVQEVLQNRVDLFVHDAPVVLWAVAGNEANLAALLRLLNEEPLGWGLRQGEEELRGAVDGALARWRTDGTRERILSRWLPYWRRLEEGPRP